MLQIDAFFLHCFRLRLMAKLCEVYDVIFSVSRGRSSTCTSYKDAHYEILYLKMSFLRVFESQNVNRKKRTRQKITVSLSSAVGLSKL